MIESISYKSAIARDATSSIAPELWNGLSGAWLPSLGVSGQRIVDLSPGRNTAIGQNGPTWESGAGWAVRFDSANERFVALSNKLPILNSTWVCRFKPLDSTWHVVLAANSDASQTLRIQSGSINSVAVYSQTSSSPTRFFTRTGFSLISVGEWYTVAVAVPATVADYTDVRVFIDGKDSTSGGNNTGENSFATGGQLWIGSRFSGAVAQSVVSSVFCYSRILSSREIARLSKDESLPFRALPRKSYRVPATAPSGQYSDIFNSTIFGGSVIA